MHKFSEDIPNNHDLADSHSENVKRYNASTDSIPTHILI